jgi:subtilase family serine protease
MPTPSTNAPFGEVILSLAPADPSAVDSIKAIALDRSNPTSPRYGNYLTMDQVNAMTAPPHAAVVNVLTWAQSAGATVTPSRLGATVTIKGTVGQISTLFGTNVAHVRNTETKQTVMRAGDFKLPAHVAEVVSVVHGLHGLPLPPSSAIVTPTPLVRAPGEPVDVTPALLAKYVQHIPSIQQKLLLRHFFSPTLCCTNSCPSPLQASPCPILVRFLGQPCQVFACT